MKNKTLLLLMMVPFLLSVREKQKVEKKPENQIKQYFFVMLLKGNNRTHDSATSANIQEGHMANIKGYIMKAN